MSRRGTPQVLAFVAVGVIFVYGFYSYNELKSALRRSDESMKKSKLENDNLSTQLLAANEEKAKLQSAIESDRKKFENSKEDLLRVKSDQETRCKQEKKELTDRYVKMNEELKQTKENYDNVERELRRHQDLDTQHEDERAQLRRSKQESDNEIAVLRDETANLKRQISILQTQLSDDQHNTSKKPLHGVPTVKVDIGRIKGSRHSWNDNIDNHIPQMVHAAKEDDDQEVRMQINKPDDGERKPYFEPREAKPDHPVRKRGAPAVAAVNQVVPPEVQNEFDSPAVEKPAKPLKFDVDEKLDFGGRFGHRNPVMPDDRLENDVLNARRDDFGKVRKYPHAVGNNVRADDINGQMEKPMQIAEPHVQQEEDQLQNPRNDDDNGDEKDEDDAADADDDDDYHYGGKKEADRRVNDGPHAAPFEDDDGARKGGL